MIRSAASKVMWVGRATVFLIGLAVVLGLLFGVAATALAGTGVGATFNLGQANTVNKISSLIGSATSAMLKIDNDGAGPALALQVEPGKQPMTVNSERKVARLNADKVDGQEAATLLPGGDLPSGRTLRGNYAIYDVAPANSVDWASDSISFGYRLPSAPTVRIIHTSGSGAGTPACPGTADSPEAAPSYLCIYEKVGENLETNIPNPSTGYVTRTGATLVAKNAANTIRVFYKTYGTWAVTAP